MQKLLLALAIIGVAGTAVAQNKPTVLSPDDQQWTQNPATPKGIVGAVFSGDPTKAGSVVLLQVKFPPNSLVPPHTHPYDEVATVISGTVVFGFGEKVDPTAKPVGAGTVIINPAKNPHYVKTGAEAAIIQTQFVAPGGIDYLDPTDDPRKQ